MWPGWHFIVKTQESWTNFPTSKSLLQVQKNRSDLSTGIHRSKKQTSEQRALEAASVKARVTFLGFFPQERNALETPVITQVYLFSRPTTDGDKQNWSGEGGCCWREQESHRNRKNLEFKGQTLEGVTDHMRKSKGMLTSLLKIEGRAMRETERERELEKERSPEWLHHSYIFFRHLHSLLLVSGTEGKHYLLQSQKLKLEESNPLPRTLSFLPDLPLYDFLNELSVLFFLIVV